MNIVLLYHDAYIIVHSYNNVFFLSSMVHIDRYYEAPFLSRRALPVAEHLPDSSDTRLSVRSVRAAGRRIDTWQGGTRSATAFDAQTLHTA